MHKVIALSKGDIKNVARDPILLIVTGLPIFISLLMRFGLPMARELLLPYLDLSEHYLFIKSIIVLMAPMMYGTVVGFMLLDEKDDDIMSYVSVTPIGKSGYLLYKIMSPAIVSFFYCFLVVAITGLTEVNYLALIPIALMASIQAPILALFLATFATNKVEGLSLSKAISIMDMAPLAGYLLKSQWRFAAGVFPPFWVSIAFIQAPGSPSYWFYILCGFLIHLLFLFFLLSKYKQKTV